MSSLHLISALFSLSTQHKHATLIYLACVLSASSFGIQHCPIPAPLQPTFVSAPAEADAKALHAWGPELFEAAPKEYA